jgi:hypothetical protein
VFLVCLICGDTCAVTFLICFFDTCGVSFFFKKVNDIFELCIRGRSLARAVILLLVSDFCFCI